MRRVMVMITLAACVLAAASGTAAGGDLLLRLGPEELVQAGGDDIDVPGYSVPSVADWNNDGLNDLITGQGGGGHPEGKVRIYINEGTSSQPVFGDFFFAQHLDADLTCPASGCMGCFPRVVYWDGVPPLDLLVGRADGTIVLFHGAKGTEADPWFSYEREITGGYYSEPLDVGARATPTFVKWDDDNKIDLVVGGLDGLIRVYRNCGCGSGGTPPSFVKPGPDWVFNVQENGSDLHVPSGRSSPVIMDLDGDGKKDLLTGNTNGQLLFYTNTGTDGDPNFAGYELVESDGVPIDLDDSPRSRPFVCDWTGDGYMDVLIGASDGKIHLYQSIPQPGDMDKDYDVEANDFALFALFWGQNCDTCQGADIVDDNIINMLDALKLAENWLKGCE